MKMHLNTTKHCNNVFIIVIASVQVYFNRNYRSDKLLTTNCWALSSHTETQ